MADTDPGVIRQFLGIRNNVPAEALQPGEMPFALNIDLDNSQQPSRRTGFASVLAQSASHSGWASADESLFLFVQGTALRSLAPAMDAATTLRDDLTAGLPMAYCEHAGRVYYSNGEQTGVVQDGASRSWGLPVPPIAMVGEAAGQLDRGRYLVACTFVSADGQEGGAPLSEWIDVTMGAVYVELPTTTDPRVATVVVYCTTANGAQLYEAGRYPVGTASAVIGAGSIELQRPLQTQFMEPAPAGQHVAFYRGRLYVARGVLLYGSEPHSLELFRPMGFVAFSDAITLVAPADDGIFVATGERTAWLAGAGLGDFTMRVLADFGAVPGTLAYVPLGRIGEATAEIDVPMWLSTQGIVVGTPGGVLNNRTKQWIFTPPARGAGLFRRDSGGLHQYVVTFTGA
jgi:hypothetical protein